MRDKKFIYERVIELWPREGESKECFQIRKKRIEEGIVLLNEENSDRYYKLKVCGVGVAMTDNNIKRIPKIDSIVTVFPDYTSRDQRVECNISIHFPRYIKDRSSVIGELNNILVNKLVQNVKYLLNSYVLAVNEEILSLKGDEK
jgi:hypothetical protein